MLQANASDRLVECGQWTLSKRPKKAAIGASKTTRSERPRVTNNGAEVSEEEVMASAIARAKMITPRIAENTK